MPVTIQFCSDLHIEYKNDDVPNPLDYITPSASILILAGDIGSLYKFSQLKDFMVQLCKHFKIVLYIPGNHEWYHHSDRKVDIEYLENLLNSLPTYIENLIIMNRNSVVIDKYCIIGATLWSQPLDTIPSYIVKIKNMNTKLYAKMHNTDLKYIKKMLTYSDEKGLVPIVVTHHAPTSDVLIKSKNFSWLYASDLDYLFTQNIKLWIFGHTHQNYDNDKNGTRLVSNQKGKPKDKVQNFKKDFTISLD